MQTSRKIFSLCFGGINNIKVSNPTQVSADEVQYRLFQGQKYHEIHIKLQK